MSASLIILRAASPPDKRVEPLVAKISSELGLMKTYCKPGEDAAPQKGKSLRHVDRRARVEHPQHHLTHGLFKALPNSFLKVTPQ